MNFDFTDLCNELNILVEVSEHVGTGDLTLRFKSNDGEYGFTKTINRFDLLFARGGWDKTRSLIYDEVRNIFNNYYANKLKEEKEKKYYFIAMTYGASEKKIYNDVIDKDPVMWIIDMRKECPDRYALISWYEITKEQYDRFVEAEKNE